MFATLAIHNYLIIGFFFAYNPIQVIVNCVNLKIIIYLAKVYAAVTKILFYRLIDNVI